MALVFRWLSHRLSPQAAYNTGFIIYWLAGCIGFPMVVLGPRRAARLLTQGRRPSGVEVLLLILPAAGAVSSELLPNRNKIDGMLAAVMATTAVIKRHGEERWWPPSGPGFMNKVFFRGCGSTRSRTRAERHVGPTNQAANQQQH